MMPMYVSNAEETFSTLHESIISGSGGYQQIPTAQGLIVSMRLFHGDAATVQKENTTLLKVCPFF